ncbi:MAG: hypothetical protein P9L96_03890 [Candidatus Gygaella obscura]|nr:hypothetical protein [Candidatus Gygaella obscura]
MKKKVFSVFIIGCFLIISYSQVFAQAMTAEFLCDIGKTYYIRGQFSDSTIEFKKVLLIDENNKIARKYLDMIQEKSGKVVEQVLVSDTSRRLAIDKALQLVENKPIVNINYVVKQPDTQAKSEEKDLLTVSGELQLGVGITSDDVIWKFANADYVGVPQEKNWRYLWGEDGVNTYDRAIYDSLKLNLESNLTDKISLYNQIVIDPWTFIGTSDAYATSTTDGDFADIEYKYWSGDRRLLDEVYRTNKGNIITIANVKVIDGLTSPYTPVGVTDWSTNFNEIPSVDINYKYRPFRKLWLDYKDEDILNVRIFALSDQYEALTSDDPLKLSNNRIWWEESPWLDEYEPSRIFYPDDGTLPVKPGRWIRRLSFVAKDSDYNRLTFLRGASIKAFDGDVQFVSASPLSLWDEYESSNSLHSALRAKFRPREDLMLGITMTSKMGFNAASPEAENHVFATDVDYKLSSETSLFAEAAGSYTDIEEATGKQNMYDGWAGAVGVKYGEVDLGFVGTSVDRALKAENESYNPKPKFELSVKQMEKDFYPALSNYRYTRRDSFYSRHISFAQLSPENDEFRLGDGIDRGRRVISLTARETMFENKLGWFLQDRYVRSDSNKYIENDSRFESTISFTDKLTAKFLGWHMDLPKTKYHQDPFIYEKTSYALTDYFINSEDYIENEDILEGLDADVAGFGGGLRYDFNPKFAVEGVYENTNDPCDFPRILLTDSYVGSSETHDGILYDNVVPFLYDQREFFDLPPYDYYSIVKGRVILNPFEKLQAILSYTKNSNKFTAGIDENINHFGMELKYSPKKNLTFWAKYIYSKLYDLYAANKERNLYYEGHNNFFLGTQYHIDENQSLELMFGEFVDYDADYTDSTWSLSALDTQHIVRIFFRKKF